MNFPMAFSRPWRMKGIIPDTVGDRPMAFCFLYKRREFILALAGAAAAWPLAARAQQRKFARIGALVLTSADAQSLGGALREGLREFGYAEGQNFALRSADGNADRLPAVRRQGRIALGAHDRAMTQIGLDRPGILADIGELVAG